VVADLFTWHIASPSLNQTPLMKFLLQNTIIVWLGAFILTLLIFYGMDHLIMAAQGLPLNLNLTPAQ
jgi:hypothetical protein